MNKHILNFSNSFGGRLKGQGFYDEKNKEKTQNTLDQGLYEALVQRLKSEIERGKLPFIDYPFASDLRKALPKVLENIPKSGGKPVKNMLLLGIGGSALGARALQKAFAPGQDMPGHDGPSLWIADNIDVISIACWLKKLKAKDTVVTVISKSGSTIETMAQYFIIRKWLQDELGEDWTKHIIVITDLKSGPLREEADKRGLLSLPVPDNLGGRYSIFSAVGLLPAAYLGMDWEALLQGAEDLAAPLVKKAESLGEHPAFKLAEWAQELCKKDYCELIFFNYIPLWSSLGDWFSQLWAESLGKNGKGSMPLPAMGVTDQHSLQQMFLDGPANKACLFLSSESLPKGPEFGDFMPESWSFLKGKSLGDLLQAEALGSRMAMVEQDIPLTHINMQGHDEKAMGRLMSLLMLATLFTGWILDLNPLDQPAVELGKRLANAELGAKGFEEEKEKLALFLKRNEKKLSKMF